MKGKLIKIETGWFVEDPNGKMYPLSEEHFNPLSKASSFIWNDSRYESGETIDFDVFNRYVEPPADSGIHSNRGSEIPTARIVEDWDHILQGLLTTFKPGPLGGYLELVSFLKKNYRAPIRLKNEKGQ